MAINVWGTQGTVNEVQWAKLAEGFGQKYTLVSGNAVTSSGRNLSIPARVSIGCGVAVENTTAETKAVPVPAAGQWFLLVLRRQWGANRGATFELINGPTTTDAAQTTPPTTLPAARNKQPGLIDDEPVAWVHARASVTTLTIWQMQTKRDGRIPGIWAMYDANEQGLYTVFAEADNTEYVWMSGAWRRGGRFSTVADLVSAGLASAAWSVFSGAGTWNLRNQMTDPAWNNGIVIPEAGTYLITGTLMVAANLPIIYGAKLNNVAASAVGLVASGQSTGFSSRTQVSFARELLLAANDVLTPVGFTSGTAGPYGITASETSFSVARI